MSSKQYGSTRRWLNPKKSDDTGMLSWEVSASSWGIDASFDIWDCSRKISLSFDVYRGSADTQGIARAAKIDILIEELQNMKAAMGRAYAEHAFTEEGKEGFQ